MTNQQDSGERKWLDAEFNDHDSEQPLGTVYRWENPHVWVRMTAADANALEAEVESLRQERDNLIAHTQRWAITVQSTAALQIDKLQHDAIAARARLTSLVGQMQAAIDGSPSDWRNALLRAHNRAITAEDSLRRYKELAERAAYLLERRLGGAHWLADYATEKEQS